VILSRMKQRNRPVRDGVTNDGSLIAFDRNHASSVGALVRDDLLTGLISVSRWLVIGSIEMLLIAQVMCMN
jgi:hypothetical protein